ncbi:PucR family transcriptional regulator [Nocardiopsis sediminis]|uniref:PucR family transcriptional regulator n=1 Tax=Nocardiopsis sediminis TaxID=1778267 RepID=A0ABV8FKU1_9ACTN
MLTVGDLVRRPGLDLRVLAGRPGLGREVRWAHVTELADPVPWLRGGELVLTVGHGVGAAPGEQRAYVRRLYDAGCAALGFALDTWIETIPEAVLAEAAELDMPLLRVAGTTPFIAIVEAVADHHAEARLRAQQRVLAAQDAMARASLRAGVDGVLRELAAATGGEAVLFRANGTSRATSGTGERPWHGLARSGAAAGAGRPRGMTVLSDDGATILSQSLSMSGTALGRLALRCAAPVSAHTRMLANHAASLLAVDLHGARTARRAVHRQRAHVLGLLLDADAAPGVIAHAGRLLPLPAPPMEVAVYPSARPDALLDAAADTVGDVLPDDDADRVAMCATPDALVVVVPDTGARPRAGARLLAELRTALGADPAAGADRGAGIDKGAGADRPAGHDRRPGHDDTAPVPEAAGACAARSAADLRTAALRAGRAAAVGPGYRHVDDADPLARLRRAIGPGDAEEFVAQVLGRLRDHDARNGTDLVATVHRYLDHDANIEATARAMGVHRNTLRTRLRTAERVSGRPLTAHHRLELWLALTLDTTNPPLGEPPAG